MLLQNANVSPRTQDTWTPRHRQSLQLPVFRELKEFLVAWYPSQLSHQMQGVNFLILLRKK